MVSGGMLDVIFVLVEIEKTVNCLVDFFWNGTCVGADDSWLILFELHIGLFCQKCSGSFTEGL